MYVAMHDPDKGWYVAKTESSFVQGYWKNEEIARDLATALNTAAKKRIEEQQG